MNADVSATAAIALSKLATTGTVTATTFVGALTGNVTGNVTGSSGSTTGNAVTATTATIANSTQFVAKQINPGSTSGNNVSGTVVAGGMAVTFTAVAGHYYRIVYGPLTANNNNGMRNNSTFYNIQASGATTQAYLTNTRDFVVPLSAGSVTITCYDQVTSTGSWTINRATSNSLYGQSEFLTVEDMGT